MMDDCWVKEVGRVKLLCRNETVEGLGVIIFVFSHVLNVCVDGLGCITTIGVSQIWGWRVKGSGNGMNGTAMNFAS